MKNVIYIFTLMMLFLPAANAADLIIRVVSVEKIFSEAPQIEAINKAMAEKFSDKKSELQGLEKDIKTMQENYKRNELVMTEDKLNELKSKIIGNVQAFKQKEAVLTQEVQAMRAKELQTLQQSMRDIINDMAKDKGYDLILSDGVAYTKDELDISSQVLDKMKKLFEAEKK
jgi:outer membrane protein